MFEDFLAIPDLAAGMISEILKTKAANHFKSKSERLQRPAAHGKVRHHCRLVLAQLRHIKEDLYSH